jgi:hypothetical protein
MTADDESEELERFVSIRMAVPAVEMGKRGSVGGDDGSGRRRSGLRGTNVEYGALCEHQWEALCNSLEEEYAERPQAVELGSEGGGVTWSAVKWMLVCVSEAECDAWFERLKKAVLWSNKVVEDHRRAGATRQRLRATQSMRSMTFASSAGGGGQHESGSLDAAPRDRA